MTKHEGQDHYLDPETGVLKNKLGIGDEDELNKALSFFGDGNLSRLQQEVQDRLTKAARDVDLDKLPEIASLKRGLDLGPSR